MTRRAPLWLIANPDLRQGRSRALALAAEYQAADESWSIVLEGGPGTLTVPTNHSRLVLHQLAAQCVCCVGQLPLRVTLARILRLEKPARLVLELAHTEHLQQVTRLLTQGTFAEHLVLQALPSIR